MNNLYNKNRTDDLGGKSEEAVDFYTPIGVILVELRDCPNNLAGIESNNIHVTGFDSNNRISVYAIKVLTTLEDERK
jgi:hypothetical protein